MNVDLERSRSLWMDLPAVNAAPLIETVDTDVLVIGAGIAGLSTAYELARTGRMVTVVDRGWPARGMSARTSAHLAFELDDFYHELIRQRDVDTARRYYDSQAAAVDRIEEIAGTESIGCDFARVDGYLVPASEDDIGYLDKELPAAIQAGFVEAEKVAQGPGPWAAWPALCFPRQARFHPLKYLYGLLAVLQSWGVRVHGHTPIVDLEERNGVVDAKCMEGLHIRAQAAVVATNSPFHLTIPIHTKQAPYRTYVFAAQVPKGSVPDALIWDTQEPAYHYVRIQPQDDHDLLIVGGEDHKTGEQDDMPHRFAELENWARALFPQLGTITHRWSGQVMEPADYLPFVGRSPQHDRVWLITGDSGEGLTTGVAGSMILRDLVNGTENPWAAAYSPSRQMTHSLKEYLSENLDAARHWAAHLGKADVDSPEQLRPGEGAIARVDGHKVAAYRTPEGELKLLSPTCTHAGCMVRWNSFELCWDCPCHGSQFSTEGEPLQGPATKPLTPHVATVRRRGAA